MTTKIQYSTVVDLLPPPIDTSDLGNTDDLDIDGSFNHRISSVFTYLVAVNGPNEVSYPNITNAIYGAVSSGDVCEISRYQIIATVDATSLVSGGSLFVDNAYLDIEGSGSGNSVETTTTNITQKPNLIVIPDLDDLLELHRNYIANNKINVEVGVGAEFAGIMLVEIVPKDSGIRTPSDLVSGGYTFTEDVAKFFSGYTTTIIGYMKDDTTSDFSFLQSSGSYELFITGSGRFARN